MAPHNEKLDWPRWLCTSEFHAIHIKQLNFMTMTRPIEQGGEIFLGHAAREANKHVHQFVLPRELRAAKEPLPFTPFRSTLAAAAP